MSKKKNAKAEIESINCEYFDCIEALEENAEATPATRK